ncbi:hypothetical protein BLNAU_13898 [Blattamonas nauphoetae]|uniref:Uncharacterized protein n=1 Tax=Blattamonas nauphoetae TaxID=2049346 RepID=A0ABQ9XLZ5_9EUKA|nr:hypothetical protein BLNAU_13898 [Blattamonas nauphoetae]
MLQIGREYRPLVEINKSEQNNPKLPHARSCSTTYSNLLTSLDLKVDAIQHKPRVSPSFTQIRGLSSVNFATPTSAEQRREDSFNNLHTTTPPVDSANVLSHPLKHMSPSEISASLSIACTSSLLFNRLCCVKHGLRFIPRVVNLSADSPDAATDQVRMPWGRGSQTCQQLDIADLGTFKASKRLLFGHGPECNELNQHNPSINFSSKIFTLFVSATGDDNRNCHTAEIANKSISRAEEAVSSLFGYTINVHVSAQLKKKANVTDLTVSGFNFLDPLFSITNASIIAFQGSKIDRVQPTQKA